MVSGTVSVYGAAGIVGGRGVPGDIGSIHIVKKGRVLTQVCSHSSDKKPGGGVIKGSEDLIASVDVQVEFEYSSHEDDELSIKPGDTIKDVNKMDGGWWEGVLNGKRGMFPDNFVKEITKKEKVREAAPLPANKKPGGGHVANLAKNLGNSGIKLTAPVSQGKAENKDGKKKILAKATFAYSPQHDDELGLEVGEIVEVTKQEEAGWWEGTKNGKSGVFPSNFVDLVTEDSSSADEAEKVDKEKNIPEGEVQEIKGKKVKGVGLGDIFGGMPIKLRSASRDEEPKPEPKTEPRSEPRNESKTKKGTPTTIKEAPILPPKEVKEPKSPGRAKVLFSYDAENEDELSLEEGMTITVLEKELEDSGWWKGEVNGKIGVFPDNFVQLLPQEEPRPKKPPPPSLPRETPTRHGRPVSQANMDKSEPPRPPKKDDLKEDKKLSGRKQAAQTPPPPVGKKPLKHDDPKLIAQTDDMKAKEMDACTADKEFDGTEGSEKLSHPTAGRAKAPQRRLPGPKSRDGEEGPEENHNLVNEDYHMKDDVSMPMVPKRDEQTIVMMTNSNRRAIPAPPPPPPHESIGSHPQARSHLTNDPTAPENHHHLSSAPNTLPQLKRPNPLQASVHPIPLRPRSSCVTHVEEEQEPPVIKERDDKRVPPVRAVRPPPPTPKDDKTTTSPVISPQSPVHERTDLVDTASLNTLHKELEALKANTVSRDDYNALQQDLQHMREDMDKMRSQFHKKILDLMKEVDEEKKIRLNMQVEMDRVKKLVATDDESDHF